VCAVTVFFFFSSRRRHTRWPRDWSSDVCSSDLHGFKSRWGRQTCSLAVFPVSVRPLAASLAPRCTIRVRRDEVLSRRALVVIESLRIPKCSAGRQICAGGHPAGGAAMERALRFAIRGLVLAAVISGLTIFSSLSPRPTMPYLSALADLEQSRCW